MRLLIQLLLLVPLAFSAMAEEEFLPAEEAFRFVHLQDGDNLLLQWQVADKYYLYKDRIKVKADGKEVAINNYPKGKMKHDEYFGNVEVYYGFADLTVPVPGATEVEVTYQGCADAGLCYPPQKEKISLKKPQAPPSSGSVGGTGSDGDLLALLKGGNLLTTLLLFFGAGVLTAFAGCSYPMFPILSKIIVGEGEQITRMRSFTLSLAYVLPIAVVYAVIGIVAGLFGANLSAWFQTPLALISIVAILVAMALSMFGLYELQLPSALQSKLSSISGQQKGGTYAGAAIMGFISAFIVSACVVPPIVAAVTYITQTGDTVLGAAAMFCFGLGLGFPLLLLGLSASWILPKAGGWMTTVQRVMGVFLITAAIWILDRIIPHWITLTLWGLLAFSTGLYMIFTTQKAFGRVSGALACTLAGVLAVAAVPQEPPAQVQELQYHYVDSQSDLDQLLTSSDKPVLVDYYADWCVSCKKMEAKVFPQPEVNLLMQKFILAKVDITDESEGQDALRRSQQVIGPPTFLFLNSDGSELRDLRITGEMNTEQFAEHLRQVLAQRS